MKIFFTCICCALLIGAHAQTILNRSYPAKPGQQITLKFDYPIVKVSTWDKNEVSVIAHVNINEGENDSAFELEVETENGAIVISDHIKDMNKLPRRYTIVRNGKKTVFKSKDEYRAASKEGGFQQSYEGTDIDIVVEVKVPANCLTDIKAVYGIVEMTNFNATVTVDATYGGIDATIAAANTGKLQATTSYGQIYSNLDLHLTDHTERDFYNSITAEPGKGPAYSFTSTYGKIYLRKP
jgi:ribosome-associated translation inhibitor RaiA